MLKCWGGENFWQAVRRENGRCFSGLLQAGLGVAWEPRVGEIKLKEDFVVRGDTVGFLEDYLSYIMIGDGLDVVFYELRN